MNHKKLQSNKYLLEYLVDLAMELQSCGESAAADDVAFASQFFSESPTEFMHEAHVALTNVRKICGTKLSRLQLENIESVLAQIDVEFNRVGAQHFEYTRHVCSCRIDLSGVLSIARGGRNIVAADYLFSGLRL